MVWRGREVLILLVVIIVGRMAVGRGGGGLGPLLV